MPLVSGLEDNFPAGQTWDEESPPNKAHVQELRNLRRAVFLVLNYYADEAMLPLAIDNLDNVYNRGRSG